MTYAEHSGHAHYVTAKHGRQVALLAGPYRTHAEASAREDECRAIVREKCSAMEATFAEIGTSRVTVDPVAVARPGKLNSFLRQREEISPNGVSHLVINNHCMTCGDLYRHAEWAVA